MISKITIYILLLQALLFSKNLHFEKYYQNKFCSKIGGVAEYVLEDRTRVDCLTDEYAIEVDFAKKWAESIGQALYYAKMTGKKPAIYLIIEKSSDRKFLNRLKKASPKNITIFTNIKEAELNDK